MPSTQRPSTPLIGEVVGQRFLVKERLDATGRADVYRAEHVLVHKQVALKVAHSGHDPAEKNVARFQRVARVAAQIDHPNCVKISDFEQRLTSTVKLDYRSLKDDAKDDKTREDVRSKAKLEQVYLGATMIQQRYPDVNRVSRSMLQMFHDLGPSKSPARKIRKLVEELRNVQHGRVTMRNISPEFERDGDLTRLVGKV